MIARPDELDSLRAPYINIGAPTETPYDPTQLAQRKRPWGTRDYLDEIVRLSFEVGAAKNTAAISKMRLAEMEAKKANDNDQLRTRIVWLQSQLAQARQWYVACTVVGLAVGLCWMPVYRMVKEWVW